MKQRKKIKEILSSGIFTVLPITEVILKRSIVLPATKDVKGIKFWDVLIIATMLENEISTIYTENLEDFRKFKDLIVVKNLREIE